MNNNGNTVFGILAGTAVGAVVGILFAPDKGCNTRAKIAREANLAKEKLTAEATIAKENVMQSAADIKDKIVKTTSSKKKSLDEQMDSLVQNASHKADDVINTLEKKLAELKAKNKKVQKKSTLNGVS